jgi:hypothetical protein
MSATPRFELDAAVRRRDGGRLLVGGTPPRLLRLTDAGTAALDSILTPSGRPSTTPPRGGRLPPPRRGGWRRGWGGRG